MSIPIILAKVRDQIPLDEGEIHEFSKGLSEGTVSDAQAAAFAMAVCLHGLSETERVDLTLAMRDTGHVQQWDLPGPVIDKHSTGGIGDNVSLILAPMPVVPMFRWSQDAGSDIPVEPLINLNQFLGTEPRFPKRNLLRLCQMWDVRSWGPERGLLRQIKDYIPFAT
jgi:hypothetical protein